MAKKKSATRRLVILLLALVGVLVVVAVLAVTLLGNRDDSIEVETAEAEIRTLTQVVTASGKVQPEVEVTISPDVSGEIIQLLVREGDQVERGALLARIKPDFYGAQVEQAEANVLQNQAIQEQRRADLLKAESELKRQKDLFDKQVVAASAYEQAQAQYEIAKASFDAARFAVQSASARLRESREQLGKTALYAPMSGTVSQLNVELGERVVGTSQMAGTAMMRVARLDQMEIEVDVNENDVVNIALGDTASIEVDAYPERYFRGVVTEIANSARLSSAGSQEQVTNFPVKIRILDPHNAEARTAAQRETGTLEDEVPGLASDEPSFRPGMSGTVDIFTETVENVVAVPIQAVTVRDFVKLREREQRRTRRNRADTTEAAEQEAMPAGGMLQEDLRKIVFVMEGGEARVKEVETGIADDLYIEIESGLDGGETVITGPYRVVSRTLNPGDAVKVERPRRSGPPES